MPGRDKLTAFDVLEYDRGTEGALQFHLRIIWIFHRGSARYDLTFIILLLGLRNLSKKFLSNLFIGYTAERRTHTELDRHSPEGWALTKNETNDTQVNTHWAQQTDNEEVNIHGSRVTRMRQSTTTLIAGKLHYVLRYQFFKKKRKVDSIAGYNWVNKF